MRRSSRRSVAKEELIGLGVEVVSSGHPGFIGLAGRVVDETKHTFRVEAADGRELLVPKKGQRFAFHTPDGRFELDGADIAFQPEERTKKARG